MADIRIKDLTTTASSTASDDFFAADGTTNGTRKLSAYSPSFGGNATVGGTLTVSGASVFQGAEGVTTGVTSSFASSVTNAITGDVLYWGSASRGGLLRGYHDGGGTVQWQFGRYTASAFAEYLRLAGNTAANAVLTLYGTTASTGTSSGALVVSGGVGVAGAIVSGGNIGIGNVNPVVAYTSTGSLLGSGDNPQVRLSATASSGWAFSTYGNTSATGKWSAGLNAGSQGYIITNDLDLSGTAALQILPTTFAATFGGALLATGTLTANAASNAFRIANSQTPASAAATGTAGTICWDTSYIYVCTGTNQWKRAAISTW